MGATVPAMAGDKEEGLEESLEKQIEDIDRKRREVNTRLKELGGTRGGRGAAERSFTERPRDSRRERDTEPRDRSPPAKRRALDIRPPRELAVTSPRGVTSPGGTRPNLKLDEKDQKRSKRLLGNLLVGTLSRTRKDHDARAQTAQGKKRAEMEAKIAEKEKADRMAGREQRKKEYLERREAELKLRNQLAKEQAAKEFELLQLKWDQHRSNLGGFLRTKAHPPIFYRPAKPLEDMDSLLEEQKKEMDAEAEQLAAGAQRRYLGPPPGEAKAADGEDTKEEKADEADDAEPAEEEAVVADEKSDDKTDETPKDDKEVKEDDKEAKDEEE